MKKIVTSKKGFFFLAVLLVWIKTYLISVNEFNLDIENYMQAFLLFINPLSSALIFLGIALFAKGRKAGLWIIIIDTLMSIFLYAYFVFFRTNYGYITRPSLMQISILCLLGAN